MHTLVLRSFINSLSVISQLGVKSVCRELQPTAPFKSTELKVLVTHSLLTRHEIITFS